MDLDMRRALQVYADAKSSTIQGDPLTRTIAAGVLNYRVGGAMVRIIAPHELRDDTPQIVYDAHTRPVR